MTLGCEVTWSLDNRAKSYVVTSRHVITKLVVAPTARSLYALVILFLLQLFVTLQTGGLNGALNHPLRQSIYGHNSIHGL